MRFDAVAVEADRLDRFDADLKPLAQPAHEVRVPPSAAADQPARGGLLHVGKGRSGCFNRECAQGRCAVGVAQALDAGGKGLEMIAVERFRRRTLEIGVAHQGGERGGVDAAASPERSVLVESQSAP